MNAPVSGGWGWHHKGLSPLRRHWGGDSPCRHLLRVLMRSGTRVFPARIPDGDKLGSGATHQPLCGLLRVYKLSSRPPSWRRAVGDSEVCGMKVPWAADETGQWSTGRAILLSSAAERATSSPRREPHRSRGRCDRSQEGCQQHPCPLVLWCRDNGLMSSRGAHYQVEASLPTSLRMGLYLF